MLSESCTPHAPVDVNVAAESLYAFMQHEQLADSFDVIRQPAPATLCIPGCNRMYPRLQPYAPQAATLRIPGTRASL